MRRTFDFWIFAVVIALLLVGVLMVFSASQAYAYQNFKGDSLFFLKKQLISAIIGVVAMLLIANIDYRKYGKLSPILVAISIALLILVRIPGIGHAEKGAWRWINIPIFGGFQPSEIAKLAVIIFFSYSLSKRKDQLASFTKGLFPYLFVVGIFAALLLIEPHKSATIILILVSGILLFVAGAKIKHFVFLSAPLIAGMTAIIMFSDYSRKRVFSFMDPFSDLKGDGWQAVQSLYAIGSGGLFGRGFGKSLQKFLYIPEPQNDFIFSIVLEELGFVGGALILILFIILFWRGIKVALNAPDTFGSLLAVGITSLVGIQTLLNIAVVTSSIPPTGISLPFFSAGGTSLVILLCNIGILLNISRYAKYERL